MLISIRSQTRLEKTQTKLQPVTNMSKYILIVTEKPDAAVRIATENLAKAIIASSI